MATVELTIKCLCLLVPDNANRIVHVLMPSTNGHGGHAGHGEHPVDPHVVRLLHRRFATNEGLPLEGWELVLGPEVGAADTSLQPQKPAYWGEQIIDLTPVADGKLIERRLVTGSADEVVSRIILRGGSLTSLHSEAEWLIGGKRLAMATSVTWTIGDVADELEWVRIGATVDPPLASLAGLADPDEVVRLVITHETLSSLTSGAASLSATDVRNHFRAFYRLYGITNPREDQLPSAVWYWKNSAESGGSEKQMTSAPERLAVKKSFDYGCPTGRGALA